MNLRIALASYFMEEQIKLQLFFALLFCFPFTHRISETDSSWDHTATYLWQSQNYWIWETTKKQLQHKRPYTSLSLYQRQRIFWAFFFCA